MKAMLLAAGLGTRLKPFTDFHPKAMALVNGKTLLQRNVEYLRVFGYDQVIVNVHHFSVQIIELIQKNNGWGSEISVSDESNAVLETGGGLKNAEWFFRNEEQPFVLMNTDILTDLDLGKMLAFHRQHNPLATLAVTNRTSGRYFLFDEDNNLCGWRNEKSGEQKGANGNPKAFSGIHILSPRIFSVMDEQGKFSMVDVYLRLCSSHQIKSFDHSGGRLIDVGTQEKLEAAQKIFF